MAKEPDLRKLKDQATKAIEKKQYAKAADLYLQIADAEAGDPDWRQRAGEAFRKVPDPGHAIHQFERAAEGYAKGGFLLKAIAVCKVILQLDAKHSTTQEMLAELYARREGRVVPVTAPSIEGMVRTSTGTFKPIPSQPQPSPPVAAAPPPSRPVAPPPPAKEGPPPVDEPLDALPLAQLFKAERSSQFDTGALAAAAAAYEIDLAEEAPIAIAIADDEPAPLPNIPLLSSLTPDDLRHVIERCSIRDCEPGNVILRQGEEGGGLFVVVSGRVKVVSDRRELASMGEGAFFGELALLTNFPRSATVVAVEPTQLLEISRELVSEIVRRSPDVLKTLLRFFRDRLLNRMLTSSALFSSFSPDEARALSERFLFLELEPKMRVIVEGERAPGLFLLLCGEATVKRGNSEVARMSPGDVFGEISLLMRGPATATIETRSKCWALELPRDRFQEVMLTYPQMLAYVSEIADKRKQENLAGAESRVDFF